jgi:hypothetical protein
LGLTDNLIKRYIRGHSQLCLLAMIALGYLKLKDEKVLHY